jgi:hypothetical protein
MLDRPLAALARQRRAGRQRAYRQRRREAIKGGAGSAGQPEKPGTTRGSPRRSRTAKASRTSRHAVKSRCARGWSGWGRLSDDGARQHNSGKSEEPWGGGLPNPHGGARSSARPDIARDYQCRHEVRERRTQTADQPGYAGSRLKLVGLREGADLYASLPTVSGKTRRTECP